MLAKRMTIFGDILKTITSAFGSIIIISVIGFFIWASSGRFFYLIDSFIVQPSYERWVTQFDALGVDADDTVFLGDSLTEYGAWHELFPHSDVRNRGIFGDRTVGVMARLDQVIEGHPSQIFLQIGTNDLTAGTEQVEIVANVISIIDAIRAGSPQTEIYVQSLLPRGEFFQERVESLNLALEAAIEGKANWINLYPLFLDETGTSLDDSLTNDELHLNGEAYLIWRDAIVDFVNVQD